MNSSDVKERIHHLSDAKAMLEVVEWVLIVCFPNDMKKIVQCLLLDFECIQQVEFGIHVHHQMNEFCFLE